MFIEFHAIQNFAPSNLNRDDTNNPKDCEFGGVRRARISSQCIKRAIRLAPVFAQVTGVDMASRTKYAVRLLRERLMQQGKTEEELKPVLGALMEKFMSKLDKDQERTAVLLNLSLSEVEDMTHMILENWDKLAAEKERDNMLAGLVKELTKKYKSITHAPDIAMFGRMLAEKPELSMEAACQVAHAISTHRVNMEMDFYTAVDDLKTSDDNAGASMMGFTGFNSACFYRYASVDWKQLVKNLDGDVELARKTVEGFMRAAVEALPTGKQTSFAANNPPSFILVTVRETGGAWSLANAFETPVRAQREGGYVAASIQALDACFARLVRAYGSQGFTCVAGLAVDEDLELKALQPALLPSLDAVLAAMLKALPSGA